MTRLGVVGFPKEIEFEAVLRDWVEREARKDQYPSADPGGWTREQLVDELASTYEEPVNYATFGDSRWFSFTLRADDLSEFGHYPSRGWRALSDGAAISDAVNALYLEGAAEDFPDAAEAVGELCEAAPVAQYGAVVARQYGEDWPPVIIDGNHRACAAFWRHRTGTTEELPVHIGFDTLPAVLPDEG